MALKEGDFVIYNNMGIHKKLIIYAFINRITKKKKIAPTLIVIRRYSFALFRYGQSLQYAHLPKT